MNMELRSISAPVGFKPIKPRGFNPARNVQRAEFIIDGPAAFTVEPRRASPAQKRGLAFQRRVLTALESLGLFELFVPSPWMEFEEPQSGRRLCQPDCLAFYEGPQGPVATIIEIKLRHTIMAYWQLRRLYEPVVRAAFPHYEIRVCELTRSFDPATPWPEDITFLHEAKDLKQLTPTRFGVLQWRL